MGVSFPERLPIDISGFEMLSETTSVVWGSEDKAKEYGEILEHHGAVSPAVPGGGLFCHRQLVYEHPGYVYLVHRTDFLLQKGGKKGKSPVGSGAGAGLGDGAICLPAAAATAARYGFRGGLRLYRCADPLGIVPGQK